MDIGTYAAVSAGLLQMKKLEVENNNLANSSTIGFKRQFVVAEQQAFEDTLSSQNKPGQFARSDNQRVPGVGAFETYIDFSQGAIRHTGNPLDAAIRNANDFFIVNTPNGRQYTRAGNFAISQNGDLVTQDGLQVLGDGGAIQIPGPGAVINQDGSLQIQVPGQAQAITVGRLQVARFLDTKGLEPVGGARFKLKDGGAQPATVEAFLEPRSVEMSNVSAVTGMIDLIQTNRAFDAYSKAAQSLDTLNQSAITQVGKRTS